MKDKILQRLEEHWNYAVSLGYNPDRFLGIWCYGSQNYGFAGKNSDVDSKIIILPSFEDICFNKIWLSKELHYENNEHIEIKDIRLLREMLMKQNINYTEILYTQYSIINSKYLDLFNNYFIKNREIIVHYDRNKTIKSIGGQLLNFKRQDLANNKTLYNTYRLYYFLENYINSKPYIECIYPTDETHEFLWKIKYGLLNNISNNDDNKIAMGEIIQNKTRKLLDNNKNIDSPLCSEAAAALNAGVTEILKASFLEDGNFSPTAASKKEFFKKLTNAEIKAYYSIVKEIREEGNITISKLVEKNSISRPVYNNLITKMKENNIATIVNMGMKGTYIKILEPELKSEAINY
jgi:GTP-sensing pleiotropic transcriptional regulator CodY